MKLSKKDKNQATYKRYDNDVKRIKAVVKTLTTMESYLCKHILKGVTLKRRSTWSNPKDSHMKLNILLTIF
jgi:hypothetical protein